MNDRLFLLCIFLWLAGFVLYVVSFVKLAKSKYPEIVDRFGNETCVPHVCTAEDIKTISDAASAVFPNATNLEETQRLHRFDPNIFRIYKDEAGNFLGYTCVIRLTKKGVDSLKRNDFKVQNIPIEYVRKDLIFTGCDLYIGAIFCQKESRQTRGFIEGSLYSQLEGLRPKNLYARAATVTGLRTLKRRHFSELHDGKNKIGDLFHRAGSEG